MKKPAEENYKNEQGTVSYTRAGNTRLYAEPQQSNNDPGSTLARVSIYANIEPQAHNTNKQKKTYNR